MKINDPVSSSIIFNLKQKWVIQISEEGLKFNREFFKDLTPNDFSDIFIHILESKYNIKFINKNDYKSKEKC